MAFDPSQPFSVVSPQVSTAPPPFDPGKPYSHIPAQSTAPAFDPSKPFTAAPSSGRPSEAGLTAAVGVTPTDAEWDATAPKGAWSDVLPAAGAGLVGGAKDVAAAPAALAGHAPAQPAAAPYYTEPLSFRDLMHPATAAPKIAYSLAKSMPSLAGGVAGGVAGAALAPEAGPVGPLVGMAVGAGGVSAVQSLAPMLAEEMQKPGADPDKAFDVALARAGQEGLFSGATMALFGWTPFKQAAKDILLQAFAVQPAAAVAQRGVENVEQGKPVTEGMGESIPNAIVGTLLPAAVHATVARVVGGAPPPGTPGGGPTTAETVAPRVRTPEEIENQDGVGPEAAARIHQAEVRAQPTSTPAATASQPQRPVTLPPDAQARYDALGKEANAIWSSTDTGRFSLEDRQRLDQIGAERAAIFNGGTNGTPNQPPMQPSPQGTQPAAVAPQAAPAEEAGNPAAAAGVGQRPDPNVAMFRPGELGIDPDRLQYKASDEKGVTGALSHSTQFEPDLSNPLTIWQTNDGQNLVANGHQRYDLATRAEAAGQPDVWVPGKVYREADGYTADYMKVLAAYQNIAEGSGTPLDAAHVLRGNAAIPEGMRLPDLPPDQQLVQQSRGLVALSPEAFGTVENGVVDPAVASAVGARISDPVEQMAALQVLARGDPTPSQARTMVEDIVRTGYVKAQEAGQGSLPGIDDTAVQSVVPERAKVLDKALGALRSARNVYGAAVRGEGVLTDAGNVLATDANRQGKAQNERLLKQLWTDATTRGPTSDALTAAARELAAGKPIGVVSSKFLIAARKIDREGTQERVQRGADEHGAGDAGEGPVAGFTTSKGSTYDLHGDGTTTRNKSFHPEHGAADQGLKPRSQATVYVTPEQAQELSLFHTQGGPSKAISRRPDGSIGIQYLTGKDAGKFERRTVIMPRTEPAIGLHPLEIWNDGRMAHFGNPITEVRNAPKQEPLFGRRLPQPPAGPWNLFGEAAREQTPRAAEPTIRTDERQAVMPGMEPSAVQAQAARDQAGRGALGPKGEVRAADEGLFAPKPGEQKPLFQRAAPAGGETPHPDAVRAALQAAQRITGNHVRVEALDPNHDAFRVTMPDGQVEQVFGYQIGRLIRAAIEPGRTGPNLNHEAWHALEALGVIKPGEMRTLEAMALREDWLGKHKIAERYPDLDPAQRMREALAEQFATHLDTQKVLPPGVLARVAGRIRQFFARMKNALAGNGFRTADDVFNAAGRGEIGAREPGAHGEATQVSADQAAAAMRQYEAPAFGRRGADDERGPVQRRLGLPVKQRLNLARRAVDETRQLFAPTSRGSGAKSMERMVRANAAEKARANVQSTDALEKLGHLVDRLPVSEQLAITDHREAGLPQQAPELDKVIDALRQEQGKWAQRVRSLGPEYLKTLRENYMGHIWANYREWRDGIEAEDAAKAAAEGRDISQAQARGKSPLKGSGAFLKQRTFDTQREGMEAGLIPVTTNPIEMQLLKLYEMQRFYHGVKLADDIKNSGLAHWVPAGDEGAARQAGWVQLQDPAFQPRVPEAGGKMEHGNWWAPDEIARVFNNYASGGLAGRSSIYDAVRGASNALNSAQLSFSGFHATFIAFDTMMSKVGLGLQQLSRGEPIRGASTIAKGLSPTTIFSTVMKGAALRDAYLHPEAASPQMRKLVQALIAGGGRIKMDPYYQSTAAGSFVKNMGDLTHPGAILHDAWQMAKDTPLTAPMRIVGRLMDTLNEPLMGVMVPRAKLGVFSDLAADFLRRNPEATPEQTADAMTKAWDSVDNRMGQLVYDNLFWNKTMKDIAFISTRSVGWNLGSLREIGGGLVDTGVAAARIGKGAADVARGKSFGLPPELTTRMAYTLAMPAITALYGAILTYAMTGQGPQSLIDYFYPPTGTETTPGIKDRTTMPGYMKDVMAFKNDMLGTIGNKTQPLAETAIELFIKNRDYYGGIINMPGVDNPLVSYPEYLMNQAIPFSWRGWMKSHEEGASMLSQALNFFGIQPAPQSITNPEKGEAYDQRQNMQALKARMKENAKGRITFGAPP